MVTGRLRTDTAALLPLIPGLRGDEPRRWIVCDDSGNGLPGPVTTRTHALVTAKGVLARKPAGYADTPACLPAGIPSVLGADTSPP